jgi:hypothetical protein
MRPAFVVALLACGLAHAGTRHSDRDYTERSESTFPLTANARLVLRSEVGDIRIHATGRHNVRLVAIKRYRTSNDAEGAAKVKELRVNTSLAANELRITGEWPTRTVSSLFRGESNLQMDFEIEVPRDTRLLIHLNIGSVQIDGAESDVEVNENIGDVTIEGDLHPRVVRLETDIGDVATNLKGTTSGMIGKKFTSILDGDRSLNVKVHIGAITVKKK